MKKTNSQLLKIEESARKNAKKLVHITSKKNFTAEDRMKYGLCRHIVQYMIDENLKVRKLAELMDIPETRVSEITRYKFQKFTLDKLLSYHEILSKKDAKFAEYLQMVTAVLEMPMRSVKVSRSIRKTIESSAQL